MTMRVASILLAAGGSTRLGSPKQLLEFQGRTLLRRAAETMLATACAPVVAVLGAGAESLRRELAGLAVEIVENPHWERGMGTSVRLGIERLLDREDTGQISEVAGVLLTLCDQPLVGPESLRTMVDAFQAGGRRDRIVAAAYNGTTGVPALFGRAFFDELRALPDAMGAKSVLQRHAASVVEIVMPAAAMDIDTRAQYEQLFPGQVRAWQS